MERMNQTATLETTCFVQLRYIFNYDCLSTAEKNMIALHEYSRTIPQFAEN